MEILEKVFYRPEETDFSNKDILTKLFIAHATLLAYYKKNLNNYLGNQAVFELTTSEGKPNNRICSNFIKYITDKIGRAHV